MPWNPDRYHKFQSQRAAPFNDLLGLVNVRPGLKVVDLGCGTGELTRRLADALPNSDVLGLDKSPHMLERAADHARAGLRFELGDLASLSASWDLIFSNAALRGKLYSALPSSPVFHPFKRILFSVRNPA